MEQYDDIYSLGIKNGWIILRTHNSIIQECTQSDSFIVSDALWNRLFILGVEAVAESLLFSSCFDVWTCFFISATPRATIMLLLQIVQKTKCGPLSDLFKNGHCCLWLSLNEVLAKYLVDFCFCFSILARSGSTRRAEMRMRETYRRCLLTKLYTKNQNLPK